MSGSDAPNPPGGKPIAGVTNLGDVEWALTRARRYVFKGGDTTDLDYLAFVDCWLDYRLEIVGTKLDGIGIGPMHTMRRKVPA